MIEINTKYEIQRKSITLRLKGTNLNLRVYKTISQVKCLLGFRSTFVKSSFTTFDLILQKCFECTVGGRFVSFRAYNRHLWKSTLQKHSVTFYLYFQLSLNKKCQQTIYLGFIWLVMMCFEFLTYRKKVQVNNATFKKGLWVCESCVRNERVLLKVKKFQKQIFLLSLGRIENTHNYIQISGASNIKKVPYFLHLQVLNYCGIRVAWWNSGNEIWFAWKKLTEIGGWVNSFSNPQTWWISR